MKRLWEELSLVPRPAWIVAACIYFGLSALFQVVNAHSADPIRSLAVLVLLSIVLPIVPAVYAVLVGYIYADAKRRGMRYVLWTLLAVFIPNAIGIILYFLMRDQLQGPCPHCGTLVKGNFAFCPACGTTLSKSCPTCRKPVEEAWTVCAWCGRRLDEPELSTPR